MRPNIKVGCVKVSGEKKKCQAVFDFVQISRHKTGLSIFGGTLTTGNHGIQALYSPETKDFVVSRDLGFLNGGGNYRHWTEPIK